MDNIPNLIDYFVICGLDETLGLETDQLTGENLQCCPLDRPYKARVLSHFPENVPGYPFDPEAVCMLCFPRGLDFVKNRPSFLLHSSPVKDPSYHAFIITDKDKSRAYGGALLFYEPVNSPNICEAFQILQAMHLAELNNARSRTLLRKREIHKDRYRATSAEGWRTTNSLTRSSSPFDNLEEEVYASDKDTLYCSKCICVISRLPFTYTFHSLLQSLYNLIMLPDDKILCCSIASHIFNIIYQLKMPSPGTSLRISTNFLPIVCQRPAVDELPLLDHPLRVVFDLLGIEQMLAIFSSLLLEHQILFASKEFGRLTLVSEGLMSLVFPFQWQHVYVPILPASLLLFLDAPVPYIMGLQLKKDDNSVLETCSKPNMCIVDIDNGVVDIPEDLPLFPCNQMLCADIQLEIKRLQALKLTSESGLRDSGFIRDSLLSLDDFTLGAVSDDALSADSGGFKSNMDSVNAVITHQQNVSARLQKLQENETMKMLAALGKKSGVMSTMDDLRESVTDAAIERHKSSGQLSQNLDLHTKDLLFNSAIREIFLHYFIQILGSYEKFIMHYVNDGNNEPTTQNFDKMAFLSDQPDDWMQFLAPFIETQMFASFIDAKIFLQQQQTAVDDIQADYLVIFESRVKRWKQISNTNQQLKNNNDQRFRQYFRTSISKEAEANIEKRATIIDVVAPPVRPLQLLEPSRQRGCFPNFLQNIFNTIINKEGVKSSQEEWQNKYGIDTKVSDSPKKLKRQPSAEPIQVGRKNSNLSDANLKAMVNNNWRFMEELLKECKSKTKRMLVQKMGQEAVELGHNEVSVGGVEENTLIASLCDLFERIWSHGLIKKQGKSALWSHLVAFGQLQSSSNTQPVLNNNVMTTSIIQEGEEVDSNEGQVGGDGNLTWPIRQPRRKLSRGLEIPTIQSLPISLIYDFKSVQQMSEIKTSVGYSRAFIRLSLEKKLLSRHLKELISNHILLRSNYKRYAFLRCEDEREQFLYHLLSLNAVDYHCFTNSFASTTMTYRILIYPRLKLNGGTTTANCWYSLAGHLAHTDHIPLSKHTLDFSFMHKNLGILTTMRIGHDNSGMSPKWMVEQIIVRNEITGHSYRFPCGRVIGKSSDDGALERLLVAEQLSSSTDSNDLIERCRTPPRCYSPSLSKRSSESKLQLTDIEENLSDAVNCLVKHYCKSERERGSAAGLLCGEHGFVSSLEQVFLYGFKSSRFFRNRFFIWDFLEKVVVNLETIMFDTSRYQVANEIKIMMQSFCYVVSQINRSSETIGKEERFQIFICVGIRDRLLQRWIRLISKAPITMTMYEETSFLREPSLIRFLLDLLDSLKDFRITIEPTRKKKKVPTATLR